MESLIEINKALLTINKNVKIDLPISKDFKKTFRIA